MNIVLKVLITSLDYGSSENQTIVSGLEMELYDSFLYQITAYEVPVTTFFFHKE